jgi:two-component system response regulator HydG
LVAVDCSAIPEGLLESELFGHTRSAFTDARADRVGLFVQASGGTLFLDEIGNLPVGLQPKLLRALQERTVRPVGGQAEVPFDVRIIAATKHNLRAAVEEGRFRQDLLFRIAVIHVQVPPLREREDDVLLLAQCFVERAALRAGKQIRGLSPGAVARLQAHAWPGNVRELQSSIERAVALTTRDEIAAADLPEHLRPALCPPAEEALAPLAEVERLHILGVLDAVRGNRSRAASILGIDRKTLQRKLGRFASESND